MKKAKKGEDNTLPFTLYAVESSEENKHANTTFLFCTNRRMFAVANDGYCQIGQLLLAEWEGDKLKALSQASIRGSSVVATRCIKGSTTNTAVPMTKVTDRR